MVLILLGVTTDIVSHKDSSAERKIWDLPWGSSLLFEMAYANMTEKQLFLYLAQVFSEDRLM